MENPTPISSTLLLNVPFKLHTLTTFPTTVCSQDWAGLTVLHPRRTSSCSLRLMATTGVEPLTNEVFPFDYVIVVGELKLVLTTLDGAVRKTP